MGILSRLEGRPGAAAARAQYGYAAAQLSRITASLQAETQFINTTLRFQLRILRARARQAAQNNPFAKRFVQMVVDNVCGSQPFRIEGKVKFQKGTPNDAANDAIEECWEGWGRPGNCEITGKWSWNTVQRLLVRGLATDGELLFRKLKGPDYGPHGYQLQVIDVDRLWEYKNEALPGGGAIHASVEVDADAKPVAYWLLRRRPSQWQYSGYSLEMDRVPADEIVHIFVPEFAEQVRGVPWMYAALLNLVNMGAFEEAAVIAARVGAANMGFIESPDGMQSLANMAGPGPDGTGSEKLGGEKGDPSFAAEPGMMIGLPPGYKFNNGWNPKYPDAAVEPFIKAMLRGVAAGLGVAYHNLANDLENVNYSSARIGELDERDMWMGLQQFVCEHLHWPLYADWMPQQVLMGTLPFPVERLSQYLKVYFQARRWAWVDPLKEVGAAIEAINAKLKSRTRIAAEAGDDLEDVFDEIEAETALAEEHGIDLDPVSPKTTGVVNEPGVDGSADGTGGDGQGGNKARWRDPARGADPEDVKPVIVHNHINIPERKTTIENHVVVGEKIKHEVGGLVKLDGLDQVTKEVGKVSAEVQRVLGGIREAAKRAVKIEGVEALLEQMGRLAEEVRKAGSESAETLKVVIDTTRLSVAEVRRLGEIAAARRVFITDKEGNPIGSEPVLAGASGG